MDTRTVGVISALVGASLWGFSGTCAQYLIANYAISTLFLTMVRMLGAGLLFLPVIHLLDRGAVGEVLRNSRALKRFLLFGAGGLYLCQVTYVIAIAYTNAGTATVLQSLNIVIIMLATCILARRLPRPAELAGLVLAISATVLIATQGNLSSLHLPAMGLFWGFATAATATLYSMLPGPLYARWKSPTVVGFGMLFGGLAAAVVWGLAFPFPVIDQVASGGNAVGSALVPQLDAMGVAVLLVVVVVGTFLAFFLYLHGLSLVGAVQGSQLGAMEPVSAVVCSAVLMGTAFSVPDWLGLALMVGTILLVASGGKERGEAVQVEESPIR